MGEIQNPTLSAKYQCYLHHVSFPSLHLTPHSLPKKTHIMGENPFTLQQCFTQAYSICLLFTLLLPKGREGKRTLSTRSLSNISTEVLLMEVLVI